MMSPFDIGVLLHYYAHVDDHPRMRDNPPVWRQTVEWMLADDLLMASTDEAVTYQITERGRAYVNALQAVPLPVSKWITEWPKREDQ
jgi:hypothetical protein